MLDQLYLINLIILFFINLIILTINKNKLTCRGVSILNIIMSIVLIYYCLDNVELFLTENNVENIILSINSNNWLNISYEFNFKIDFLSYVFLLLIFIISLSTNIYILVYFQYEERQKEFILLINWFIISMIFLVISNNFFSILIGWEMIGITSFLLINFWKTKPTTILSGFKAFIFNKLSDVLLMISFSILWVIYKTDNIDILNILSQNTLMINYKKIYLSLILLIISSGIKSAQLVGHLWLPDSMEAPIPASALIHSATLVSAGIFLLLKFQIFIYLFNLDTLIIFWGSITAAFGGLCAMNQTDLKKLLAYSTISHCGFLFTCVAYKNIVLIIIYLYLHGLFKASTFLCAGSIIKLNNTQDTRLLGNISKYNFYNSILLIILALNLSGFPLMIGYLYKKIFFYFIIVNYSNYFSFIFQIIGILTSIVYACKIIFYVLYDFRKGLFYWTVYLIQNNKKKKNKKFYATISEGTLLSIWLILSFSFIFYITFKYSFLSVKSMLDIENLELIINKIKFKNNIQTFILLYKTYYLLFIYVIINFYFIHWKKEVSIILKIKNFFFLSFFYICMYLFN